MLFLFVLAASVRFVTLLSAQLGRMLSETMHFIIIAE